MYAEPSDAILGPPDFLGTIDMHRFSSDWPGKDDNQVLIDPFPRDPKFLQSITEVKVDIPRKDRYPLFRLNCPAFSHQDSYIYPALLSGCLKSGEEYLYIFPWCGVWKTVSILRNSYLSLMLRNSQSPTGSLESHVFTSA